MNSIKKKIKKVSSYFFKNDKINYTDKQCLDGLRSSMRNRDYDEFRKYTRILLENLSERKFENSSGEFSEKKFLSWCRIFNHHSGFFLILNGFFLLKQGNVVDAKDNYDLIVKIYEKAIKVFKENYKVQITSIEDWHNNLTEIVKRARHDIGNSLSYIARLSYSNNCVEEFNNKILNVVKDEFDIVIASLSFASISFVKGRTKYFKQSEKYIIQGQKEYKSGKKFNPKYQNYIRYTFNKAADNLLGGGARKASVLNKLEIKGAAISFKEGANNAPKSNVKQLDFLENREKFEKDTIANIEKPLEFVGARIIETRRFLSQENYDLVLKSLTTHLSADRNKDKVFSANYAARYTEAIVISDELEVVADYKKSIKNLTDWGFLTPSELQLGGSKEKKKVVLFCFDQDKVLPTYIAPILPILQKKGYKLYNISDDVFCNDIVKLWKFSDNLSPDLRDVCGKHLDRSELFNKWSFNPDKKELICDDVNYYEGMYERIGRVLKVYNVDWNLPSAKLYLEIWLLQLDRMVFVFNQVREIAEKNNIKISLFSLQSHFVPYFGLKKYAEKYPNVFSHITFSSSYENWKTNMLGNSLSTVTLQNNTKKAEPSLPAFGSKKDFESWYKNTFTKDQDLYKKVSHDLVNKKRSGDSTKESKKLLKHLTSLKKSKNKKVFCMLGKIPYDLAVPYQGGPAHSDMKDWINHTVSCFKDNDNILLIKPHPHEKNNSIANMGNEGFLDLIDVEYGDNCIKLPHKSVNLSDLSQIVDVFLCWNGSSIAELGAQGLSVIAADDWAYKNYPIGVYMPKDRSHFQDILQSKVEVNMHKDFQIKSLAYTVYLTQAPFSIKYPFCGRSATNVNFNHSWVNWDCFTKDKLNDFYKKYTRKIVDEFKM